MTGSVAESVRVDSINRVFDWSMLLGTKSMEDPGVREVGIISGGELRDVRGDSSMRGKLTKGEVVYATVEADATGSVPARFTSCNRFLKAGVKRTGVCNGLGIVVLCLAETRLRFCLKSIINPPRNGAPVVIRTVESLPKGNVIRVRLHSSSRGESIVE
jgi:hypothetical protein